MKAVVDAVAASSGAGSNLSGVQSGRVNRRKDVENEEIQMYLSKLKDLVPFMPKNKKLSKLEVIEYVIDYICDLQSALETHPAVSDLPSLNASDLAARFRIGNGVPTASVPMQATGCIHSQQRQPLGVLTSGPNARAHNVGCKSPIPAESTSHRTMSPVLLERVQETDSRPISC